MSHQIVNIKENPNAGNLGLEKSGRSKFPGCVDIIQPAKGIDMRWKTGLDENAASVLAIRDSEEREAKINSIKQMREELELLTGLDLSATSKYWEGYFITINTASPLNLANPIDKIKYHVLMAGEGVAPNLKDTVLSEYKDAKYYISREFEEVGDRVTKKKRTAEAGAALLDLLKSPDKAVLIGQYLDLRINNNTPPDNVFDIFQTYLDDDDKLGSIDKFMYALQKSPEEISVKLIFNDAIKLNVIRQREGLFQRGNITLGKSPVEVLSFLADIKNSSELLSIQDEVEMKKKFG